MMRARCPTFRLRKRCLTMLPFLLLVYAIAKQLHLWITYSAHDSNLVTVCNVSRNKFFLLSIPNSGTSTTTSIAWRFALVHKLAAILPQASSVRAQQGPDKAPGKPFFPPYHTAVGMEMDLSWKSHVTNLDRHTSYITILRHPMFHLLSVFRGGGEQYMDLKLKDFLNNPKEHEEKWRQYADPVSLTDNPFCRVLGLDPVHIRNTSSILRFILKSDQDFTAVLILEKLDESLVMLRRLMCWSFTDIIYNLEDKHIHEEEITVPEDLAKKHQEWAMADYKLYDHFSSKLENYISQGGDNFAREVAEFKKTVIAVNHFCNHVLNENEFIDVGTKEWGNVYRFTVHDCMMLLSSSQSLRNMIRERDGMPLEVEILN